MITFFNALEGLLYCLIFVAAILLCESLIVYYQIGSNPKKAMIQTVIMTLTTTILTGWVYSSHCSNKIGFLECIYINPGEELMKNIGIALFINTSLFLGGLHQWLYVYCYLTEWRDQKKIFIDLQTIVSVGSLQKTLHCSPFLI